MNEELFNACCSLMQDYPENAPRARQLDSAIYGLSYSCVGWRAYIQDNWASLFLTHDPGKDWRLRCTIEGYGDEVDPSTWLELPNVVRLFEFWNSLTMKDNTRLEIVYGFWMPAILQMTSYDDSVTWSFDSGKFGLEIIIPERPQYNEWD